MIRFKALENEELVPFFYSCVAAALYKKTNPTDL